jgi:23S rRNA pseudouridine2605 synthase
VGRLDFDSEGLLLLTDDGDFAQHIAHPRYGCHKTYEVKVKGRPAEKDLQKLRSGVVLNRRRTATARITGMAGVSGPRDGISNTWWLVVLQEGRPRQIREMFFRIGHSVSRLRRVAIGPVRDRDLARGAWRVLSETEVELLRQQTAKVRPKSKETPGKEPKVKPKKASSGRETAVGRGAPGRGASGRSTGGRSTGGRSADSRSTGGRSAGGRSSDGRSAGGNAARNTRGDSRTTWPKGPSSGGRGKGGKAPIGKGRGPKFGGPAKGPGASRSTRPGASRPGRSGRPGRPGRPRR